jgi:hypothetical protein
VQYRPHPQPKCFERSLLSERIERSEGVEVSKSALIQALKGRRRTQPSRASSRGVRRRSCWPRWNQMEVNTIIAPEQRGHEKRTQSGITTLVCRAPSNPRAAAEDGPPSSYILADLPCRGRGSAAHNLPLGSYCTKACRSNTSREGGHGALSSVAGRRGRGSRLGAFKLPWPVRPRWPTAELSRR